MTKPNEIYKCSVCEHIVEVIHTGVGTLVCCGKPMELLVARESDPELGEKHVPVIEKNDEGVTVRVGSVPHPMTQEHYIEWIEISTEKGYSRKYLKPGDHPETSFPVKADQITARIYCNLHGLWKA